MVAVATGLRKKKMEVGTSNEFVRHAWIEQSLKKIPQGYKILDAGAGELKFKKFCQHLEYVSQDFSQYKNGGDHKGLHPEKWDTSQIDIVSDITSIPVKDESFDAIMCIEVIEHVPDPVKAMNELDRILKNGGYLIITAPFNSLTHFAPYHFSTGFSKYFYEYHLNAFGYEIIDMHTNGNYFEYLGQELHRLPSISSRYAGRHPNFWERKALSFLLSFLRKTSMNDKGSDELLNFGIMVLAQKR